MLIKNYIEFYPFMNVSERNINRAVAVFRKYKGVMRTKDAIAAGVHPRTLYYMRDEGIIFQVSRGLYELGEESQLNQPDFILVTRKVPEARICLISALDFHNLTDQIPNSVYIALPRGAWEPNLSYPPVKTFRFSELTYGSGVEMHSVDGEEISIYSPAKTIADCFKFRNQIGLDVCIEALKRAIDQKKATYGDILRYAKMCKVTKVITPYLEIIRHI